MIGCIRDLLEFDGERNGVKKDIDLEDADEEESKVLEHLCEEIPKQSDVWCKIWNRQTVENTHTIEINQCKRYNLKKMV